MKSGRFSAKSGCQNGHVRFFRIRFAKKANENSVSICPLYFLPDKKRTSRFARPSALLNPPAKSTACDVRFFVRFLSANFF
jgi:hypothetical protein